MSALGVARDAYRASRKGAGTADDLPATTSSVQNAAARAGSGTGRAFDSVQEFLSTPVELLRGLPGMGFLPQAGTTAGAAAGLGILFVSWNYVLPRVM